MDAEPGDRWEQQGRAAFAAAAGSASGYAEYLKTDVRAGDARSPAPQRIQPDRRVFSPARRRKSSFSTPAVVRGGGVRPRAVRRAVARLHGLGPPDAGARRFRDLEQLRRSFVVGELQTDAPLEIRARHARPREERDAPFQRPRVVAAQRSRLPAERQLVDGPERHDVAGAVDARGRELRVRRMVGVRRLEGVPRGAGVATAEPRVVAAATRRRRDSSPRTIRVAAAASPRPVFGSSARRERMRKLATVPEYHSCAQHGMSTKRLMDVSWRPIPKTSGHVVAVAMHLRRRDEDRLFSMIFAASTRRRRPLEECSKARTSGHVPLWPCASARPRKSSARNTGSAFRNPWSSRLARSARSLRTRCASRGPRTRCRRLSGPEEGLQEASDRTTGPRADRSVGAGASAETVVASAAPPRSSRRRPRVATDPTVSDARGGAATCSTRESRSRGLARATNARRRADPSTSPRRIAPPARPPQRRALRSVASRRVQTRDRRARASFCYAGARSIGAPPDVRPSKLRR